MPPKQRDKLEFIFERRAATRYVECFRCEWVIPTKPFACPNCGATLAGNREYYGSLSVRDERAMIKAIISLHEACLIDLGRLNDGFTAIVYGATGKGGNNSRP
jgi:hypothetical protein